jgi:hypothetical protein
MDLYQPVGQDSTHLPGELLLTFHVVRVRHGCQLRVGL